MKDPPVKRLAPSEFAASRVEREKDRPNVYDVFSFLNKLDKAVRNGSRDALRDLRAIRVVVDEILVSLPREAIEPRRRVHLNSANKLAALLFDRVQLIRKGRLRCTPESLATEIKGLLRYSKHTHSDWWDAAWAWAKATTHVEVKQLIRDIGYPGADLFFKAHDMKIKAALTSACERGQRAGALGSILRGDAAVTRWMDRMNAARIDYARRQTKKAAAANWPGQKSGPNRVS